LGEVLALDKDISKALAAFELIKNDLSLISEIIGENSKKTHDIFQSQLSKMREIRDDIKSLKAELLDIKNKESSEELKRLEDVADLTKSVLERSDNVIQNLQGFVTILQSQDRVDQMIEGSSKVANEGAILFREYNIPNELKNENKNALSACYTIKEQREFATGVVEKKSIDKITLF